jgi:CRISPR-associated endoribonuclease Cas6
VVRIPAGRCKEYGIDPEGYDDVYWRLKHNKKAFIEEVERNLASKYREYHDEEPPDRPYFTDYRPRKEVAVPVKYDDRTVDVVGTTWELEYECQTRPMYRIIKMAYSAGVGELNTTGFGFMNEVETN